MLHLKFYQPLHQRQKGATLITTLAFLSLMTIVSVSAAKISILDVLASGNEQQQSILFQEAAKDLKNLATVRKLYKPITKSDGASFSENTGIYKLPDQIQNPDSELQITDKDSPYECNGFNGKALSLGPSVPRCYLYDFEAKVKRQHIGSSDKHNRGAGKEKPNPLKNSYLSQ